MGIKLYTTHCPKCNVLTKKLNAKNIVFTEITDIEQMTELGISNVPVLRIDGKLLEFEQAVKWINEIKE